ncbi:MAG: hypothetical protein OEV89_07985, partial [Desulfobulbaceae bacterium]|nr:hypothetical protein [Desulfobulbaceae bacterium]HIJ90693.1 hypothetical protein [Deltaproteobacteria bacterium]
MSLNAYHTTNWLKGDFNADLEYLLKVAENNDLLRHPNSYLKVTLDSKGRPVIGYGYDLYANKDNGNAVAQLTAVGVVLTDAQKTAINNLTITGSIPNALVGLSLPSEAAATVLLGKAINEGSKDRLSRMAEFNVFLSSKGIVMPDSLERAVLFSMWYQLPGGGSNGKGKDGYFRNSTNGNSNLTNALIAGDRATAWYEIRYGSAAVKLDKNGVLEATDGMGVVVRRFAESELFGLYDNGDGTSNADEASSVYRMYTAHRDKILKYEATFGNRDGQHPGSKGDQITAANTRYTLPDSFAVDSLSAELTSAAKVLLEEYVVKPGYGSVDSFNALNIQVASDKAMFLVGENTVARTGSDADLLIGRDGKNDILTGQGGNDLLIGLGGDDILEGGKGDDVLVGGKGNDTYIWRPGDGNDRIVEERDSDGKIHGTIRIEGLNYDLLLGGAFIQQGSDNIWKANFGNEEITLTHNSPWKLILADGSEIELGDFQDGDFGISLEDDTDPVVSSADVLEEIHADAQGNPVRFL